MDVMLEYISRISVSDLVERRMETDRTLTPAVILGRLIDQLCEKGILTINDLEPILGYYNLGSTN